jgi:YidC/Oxa1 family membrane protein insertase
MAGCLPLLIQLPVIWAFYQSISRALAYRPGEMLVLTQYLSAVPKFMSLVPLPNNWLWFNLAKPDAILLPLLVAGTTWLQQKLSTSTTQAPSTDPQAAQMSQSMMITMPLMFGYIAMQMPAGLSIYFIVSNVVGTGIQWLTNRLLADDQDQIAPVRRPQAPQSQQAKDQAPTRTKKSAYKKRGYRRRN